MTSPVPHDAPQDRSGGLRARVTTHALRRYAERGPLALGDLFEGCSDPEALEGMEALEIPVTALRDRLAYYGGVGLRYGASGVLVDGVGLVVADGAVVTVVPRRAA